MATVKQLISSKLLNEGLKYIEKDPMNNMHKLLDWAEKIITRENHKRMLETSRKVVDDPESNWYKLIERYFNELSPASRKKFLINYMVNSGMVGIPIQDKMKKSIIATYPGQF